MCLHNVHETEFCAAFGGGVFNGFDDGLLQHHRGPLQAWGSICQRFDRKPVREAGGPDFRRGKGSFEV